MGRIMSFGQDGRLMADFDKDAYQPAYVAPDEGVKLAATLNRLQAENSKLRELTAKMARALGVGRGWCTRDCGAEFQCEWEHCPIETALRELGIEVTA